MTIDNDIDSPRAGMEYDASLIVGSAVNLDPCGLYKHSPKGINECFIEDVLALAQNERELPIELREMIANAADSDIDFLIEWTGEVLTSSLAEKRKRVFDRA